MEPGQIERINGNLTKLINYTLVNVSLLTELQQVGILSDEDMQLVESKDTPLEQAAELYRIMKTKENGYIPLISALRATSQSGAYSILLAVSSETIKGLRVGLTHTVENLLSNDKIAEIETWAKENLSVDERQELHKSIFNQNLWRDTIPPSYPLYIPRFLFRRLVVNPNLFKESSQDVFVFKNANRSQLRTFIASYAIESSATQLQLIEFSARFILLDVETDWKKICDKLIKVNKSVPVHLLKYEESSDTFLLEATCGSSNVLLQNLENKNESKCDHFSEDLFIKEIASENVKGVCICDIPGMGKSLLLASLARKISQNPNSIVFYTELKNFDLLNKLEAANDTKSQLLQYISTSKLAKRVLDDLIKSSEIKLELFFDGLEEVGKDKLELVTKCLKKISESFPEARIYVASRPVLRSALEKTLGAIAYDILPFDDETQLNFLVDYWISKEPSSNKTKLIDYAEKCLQKIKAVLKKSEMDIAGTPLLCKLIGEIYSELAAAYADPIRKNSVGVTTNFASSLSDIYSQFMNLQLGKTNCKFKCMLLQNESAGVQCDIQCQVKSFHAWKSIQILFPSVAETLSDKCVGIDSLNLEDILLPGLLRKPQLHSDNENKHAVEFVHQTYAEYLVAEYFAMAVFTEQQKDKDLMQLVFDQIFTPGNENRVVAKQDGWVVSAWKLREHVVAHFLNELVNESYHTKMVCTAKLSPLKKFVSTLEGCMYENSEKILKLYIKASLNSYNEKLSEDSDDEMVSESEDDSLESEIVEHSILEFSEASNILRIAALVFNKDTVEKVCQAFLRIFHEDLIQHSDEDDPTPLCLAIWRADYELVQYFSENLPLENRGLIYKCIEGTYFENQDFVDKRLDIAEMLIKNCTDLLKESEETSCYPNPVLAYELHLHAIKFLLENGANFQETGENGRNVLNSAAEYMSVDDFCELCKFLLATPNAQKTFFNSENLNKYLRNRMTWTLVYRTRMLLTFLQYLNTENPSMISEPEEILQTLLNSEKSGFYETHKNMFSKLFQVSIKEGSIAIAKLIVAQDTSLVQNPVEIYDDTVPILFIALEDIDIVKFLVEKGASVFSLDSKNQTILHYAAKSKNLGLFCNLVTYLGTLSTDASTYSGLKNIKSNGPSCLDELFNWSESDFLSTPLHYAIQHLYDLPENSLKLFLNCGKTSGTNATVKINAVDKEENTALHAALQCGVYLRLNLVKSLVKCGIKWKLENKKGCNAAHICVQMCRAKHLEYFISLGFNVNQLDSEGNNALQRLVATYSPYTSTIPLCETIQVLVDKGVNKVHKNHNKLTAYDIGVDKKCPEYILKMLALPET